MPVNAMNSENMILMKHNLVTLVKFVESSLVQRVVYDSPEEISLSLDDPHPEVFAPAP